jgi:hypothetical protein
MPKPTFCGCVEERCRWFTQRLTRTRISLIDDVAVRFSGEAVTDEKVVAAITAVLNEQLDVLPCYLRFEKLLPVRHRFVVTSVGKYGSTEASVSGAVPRLQRCVDDAFAKLFFAPADVSDTFVNTKQLQVSGVLTVKMAWKP